MTNETLLRSVAPADMAPARAIAHCAAQHLTKAARANLTAQPDDSHSNLGWDSDRRAFLSQPIEGKSVGLSFAPLRLFMLDGNQETSSLLLDGKTDLETGHWLDERLAEMSLNKASDIALPYELPAGVAAVERYPNVIDDEGLSALAAWFDAASATLTNFAAANADTRPGPSPVRCWPHHFDIATYVSFETGDPETARGVGVGLSPGDEGYDEPYLYINPWPHLDANALPDAVSPGHWHMQGYVGLIATASELSTQENIALAITEFVGSAFAATRKAQGL